MGTELFIGLMSGTSLDGVDAVLVEFSAQGQRTLETSYLPYHAQLRQEILALSSSGHDELHRTARLAQHLAELYAKATTQLLAQHGLPASAITAIGCHGQTLRHRPDAGYSLQVNNPALLAELTGIAVIADFRSRDIAASGQGAPLVPAFHAALFQDERRHRVLLNLGGIANLTNLRPGQPVQGFDCGPANILLDAWIEGHLGKPYDEDGRWAATGTVLPALLKTLLTHPFFSNQPPKSCGREEFNLAWLQGHLSGQEKPEDVQATLLHLTAQSAANAVHHWCGEPDELFVCGGGAHNQTLLEQLGQLLPGASIASTESLGIPPDWVEAVAFAWLARQHTHHQPGNLPEVTGARGRRILGACYPA
ncbi:anhydro-N-acetylmuramic acid kinase [Denitratisoma sp. agr-D3]